MFVLIATIIAILICCATVVFAVAVLLSSRRPYLVGAAVAAAFVAGVCFSITFQTPSQPSVFEMTDALYVCEANTGINCSIHWRAFPRAHEVPIIIEQSEIASTR